MTLRLVSALGLALLIIGSAGSTAVASVRGAGSTTAGPRGSVVIGRAGVSANVLSAQATAALAQNEVAKAVSMGPAFLRGDALGSATLLGRSSSQKRATELVAAIRPDRTSTGDFSSEPMRYHVLVGVRASQARATTASLTFRNMHESALGTRVLTYAAKAKTDKGPGNLIAKVQQVSMSGQWQTKSALVTFIPAGFDI